MLENRSRGTWITVAKLLASGVLLAATLGFLWHDRPVVHWTNIPPPFLSTVASGWYGDVFWAARNLFSHSMLKGLVYLGITFSCILALFAAPFISSLLLRCLVSAFLVFGIGYDLTMFDIGGALPSFATTQTLLTNAAFGLQGTAQIYLEWIARNAALALIVLIVFCLPPPRLGTFRHLPMLAMLVALAGVGSVFVMTKAQTRQFPSPFESYLNVLRTAYGGGKPHIRDVAYDGTPSPALRKIVLVVDESVRGDYLSINQPAVRTTPFLESRRDEIDNFGIAVSGANCSLESRKMLRSGTQERDLRGITQLAYPGPTFWQYAQRAGFQTVYVDSYGSPTRLTHGMTGTEFAFVDRHVVADDMPQYERDEKTVDRLRDLLNDPAPMFIFVEKYGVHVPYNAQYPDSENIFHAAHDRTFDPGDRPNLIAQYSNATRWSVDRFFEHLLQQPLPPGTLLIYTSDHGQALSENDRLQTHCSQGRLAIRQEADIPLFAMTSDATWQAALLQAAHHNRDRASALDIFPTLLLAMGYDAGWLDAHYQSWLTRALPAGRKRVFWAMTNTEPYD